MAEIINGEFVRNDTNQKSMGGTEMLTMKVADRLDKSLLEDFQIVSSYIYIIIYFEYIYIKLNYIKII